MRKMPVLTMVCLVAVGLLAMPVHSATVEANDTPDIILSPGGSVSIDLADFFASAEGPLTYSAEGASVAGSVATVNAAGTAKFTAGGVSVESTVVSGAPIGNAPMVDDNNRIAGKAGGNVFYNALVPGGVINSSANLAGLPAGGGGGSPGGGTGGAIATIASIDVDYGNTGLRMVSRSVAEGSGLNASVGADGSYSIAADANFSGTWLVTIGVPGAAAVHVLAAEAIPVAPASLNIPIPAGSLPQGAYANGTFTLAAGQGLLVAGSPIQVGSPGDVVTLVLDYNASANVNIAAVLFDGALGSILAHTNPSGANIETGTTKSLSMSMVTYTGTVVPAVQCVAGAAAATVSISNIAVVKAGPVTDYALNPNAKAYSNSLASTAGLGSDILGTGASGPVADGDNNFASADGAGSIKLAGSGGISNAFVQVALQQGTAVAECFAKKVSGDGTLALVITDGGALSSETFVSGLGSDWSKVIAVGTLGAPTNAFLVVQAAGFDALVDDLSVRVVNDLPEFADLSLLN